MSVSSTQNATINVPCTLAVITKIIIRHANIDSPILVDVSCGAKKHLPNETKIMPIGVISKIVDT